jgi:hypothetical protein
MRTLEGYLVVFERVKDPVVACLRSRPRLNATQTKLIMLRV